MMRFPVTEKDTREPSPGMMKKDTREPSPGMQKRSLDMKKKGLIIVGLLVVCAGIVLAVMVPRIHENKLRQKVGMMFIVRPDALDLSIPVEEVEDSKAEGIKEITDEMRAVYDEYPCAGFTIFGKNIENEEQLIKLTGQIHDLGDVLICIDEEGGIVARIANNENFAVPKFENMETIAQGGDTGVAYTLGKTIGGYLDGYGVDVDFAPVADVNTNPDNTVIGKRAFGSDPVVAGEMVAAAIDGFHASDTACTIKHFPGHGDTSTDTHSGYAETLKTWDEMKACEMISFEKGIEAGADLVMVAHIAAPEVTGNKEPATLSYELITNKLKGELGFDGVVITDAMAMGAIVETYGAGEAAVRAIEAGVDIVLMPMNYVEAYDAVLEAVKSGRISEKRLDESNRRVKELMKREFPTSSVRSEAVETEESIIEETPMISTYSQITQEEAKKLMDTEDDYIILDVREQDEYDEGHIPGAILMPYTSAEELAEELLPDKDQMILVYCRSGRRSKVAAQTLASRGYTDVREFGGIIDWPYEVE